MASLPGDFNDGGTGRFRVWRSVASRAILFVAVAASGVFGVAAPVATAPTEDQVKAAFLLNFPKYIAWPAGTSADDRSPIVVTVIGDKSVEKEVRRMGQGKLFNGRALEVRSLAASDEIASDCQILFIGLAEERRAAQIIAKLGERSVLTIGESDDFFDDGGMIKLIRREQKIRLAIDLSTAEAKGLRISSKLLSVADVVKRREGAQL